MANRSNILKQYYAKATIGGSVSIKDLKNRERNRQPLTFKQIMALRNFEKYKTEELKKAKTPDDFDASYRRIQVVANMGNYEDFLQKKYFW